MLIGTILVLDTHVKIRVENISLRALFGLHVRAGHLGTGVVLRDTLMGTFREVASLHAGIRVNTAIIINDILADCIAGGV